MWPDIKPKNAELKSDTDGILSVPRAIGPPCVLAAAEVEAEATATAKAAARATATTVASPPAPKQQPLSLREGLVAAGVGDAMMGIADAGYANTVGAALEDTSLAGTCFLEHEWDVDGDRTFVLKVRMRSTIAAEDGEDFRTCKWCRLQPLKWKR